MISAAEETLAEDEELEITRNPSVFDSRYIWSYIVSVLAALAILSTTVTGWLQFDLPVQTLYLNALLVLPFLYAFYIELRRRFTMYHLTDRKVLKESGIFHKRWTSINYDRITHVDMVQNFWERIFGVSDLYVATAGEGSREMRMNGMKDPHNLKRELMSRSGSSRQTARSSS